MIPKIIWTIWLSDKEELPPLIEKCIKTHAVEGYEHRLIKYDHADPYFEKFYNESSYFKECVSEKKWAKAVDIFRAWILKEYGGIYLDADVEVLKPFDDLLDQPMFVGAEENDFVCNAVIGAQAGHFLLEEYIGLVERNFKASGELVFQAGVYLFTELVKYGQFRDQVQIYVPEYFYPYQHQIDVLKKTENTYCVHWFARSWLPKLNR